MPEAVIVSALRTPIGTARKGTLRDTTAFELAHHVVSEAAADLDPAQVTIAYADGYTGTDGQFHAWEHRSDAEGFRAQHADKYRPWRHDDPRHKNDH